MNSLLIGAGGAAFLAIFYAAVRVNWPDNYVSMDRATDRSVSARPWRFISFRFAPVYVVVVLISTTAESADGSPVWAGIVTISIHVAHTTVRAGIAPFLRGAREAVKLRKSLLYGGISIALVCVAVLALITRHLWTDLIPTPREMSTAVWTALIAAVLAASMIAATRFDAAALGALQDQSGRQLSEGLDTVIQDRSAYHDCDADLISSIVICEMVQRPRWVRELERCKGKLIPKGSYGVAQSPAPHPISDDVSIDLLCREFRGYRPPFVSTSYGLALSRERLRARIEERNPDPEFSSQVVSVYDGFASAYFSSTVAGPDGRPDIEVSNYERSGSEWVIRGTAHVPGGALSHVLVPGAAVPPGPVSVAGLVGRRGRWTLRVPIDTTSVLFEPVSGIQLFGGRQPVEVALM